jgi:hypothetical protein
MAPAAIVYRGLITGERFLPEPTSKRVNRDQYDAVLFDLDGVITNTAALHATCWKKMFDEYLASERSKEGRRFAPLTSPRITACTLMASPVSPGFVIF